MNQQLNITVYNEMVNKQLSGLHSAKMLIESYDLII